MIHFTADTHFMHDNIVELSSRPFPDYAAMEADLIENWNRCVAPGDMVYHLGDFALTWKKTDQPGIERLLESLNGNKILIAGNHDREAVKRASGWATVTPMHEIKVDLGGVHKQRIVLCHYPLRSWNQMHRGAWMLHGHCHGNLSDIGGLTLDVGVDVHGYAPASIEKVAAIMSGRDPVYCDHHN